MSETPSLAQSTQLMTHAHSLSETSISSTFEDMLKGRKNISRHCQVTSMFTHQSSERSSIPNWLTIASGAEEGCLLGSGAKLSLR